MRIISGELRGRRLVAPPGTATRPMLDRVRESIFSTLAPWFPGARVLDSFAGSGSLGFEALSRGAVHVRFCEQGQAALRVLRENARALGVEARCEIVGRDALDPSSWGAEPFDVVFCDPPFPLLAERRPRVALHAALAALLEDHLAAEGICVLHTPRHGLSEAELPARCAHRAVHTGAQTIWYLQRDD